MPLSKVERALVIQVPKDAQGKPLGGPVKAFIAQKNVVGQWVFQEWLKSYNRHSPDGFNVGYGGSGPAELAYSICMLFGAASYYHQFKIDVIAKLNRVDMVIPLEHLRLQIEQMKIK